VQVFLGQRDLSFLHRDSGILSSKCSKEGINCAAFGNIARSEYAIHIVNNGADCQTIVTGIPQEIKAFDIFVTDKEKGMEKIGETDVSEGRVEFRLHKAGFTTLISKK
jgi:hypothetical protein